MAAMMCMLVALGGLPLNPDALVLVALGGDHDVRLVQHKHADLLGVKDLQLDAPVEDGARCSDHDVLLDGGAARHYGQGTIATRSFFLHDSSFMRL